MSGEVALWLDPPSHHFERDRLFALETARHGGDKILAPWLDLRRWLAKRGVPVRTADVLARGAAPAERNVYISLGIQHRWRHFDRRDDVVLSAFFALESPIVQPSLYRALEPASRAFAHMYTWSTEDALRPFLTGPVRFERFRLPMSRDRVHEGVWERKDRGFLTMINANKLLPRDNVELYSERLRAVAAFERHREIDVYGVNWDGPPFRVGETWVPATAQRAGRPLQRGWQRLRPDPLRAAARRASRGAVDDKARTLGAYRFAICFENMALDGYVTEKLFDCLFAGTVPIYLGAPDIEDWVPAECFVDMRDFDAYEDLREHLRTMPDAEWQARREAGRAFLASEQFIPFHPRTFAERIGRLIEEDAGVRLTAAT